MQPARTLGRRNTWEHIRRNWGLYLLMLPAIVIFICFTYLPMYGVIIAFKDFRPAQVRLSAALMNARRPQQEMVLEPPRDTKGRVTPVSGSKSVMPKTLSESWKSSIPAAATAAIA